MSVPLPQPSVCPLDCPDRCSLSVTVEEGRVTTITGSRLNPLTEDFICDKVRRFPRRLYGPDRLLHPMRRTGPRGSDSFVRISWDDAVEEITERLLATVQRWGGEAILPYFYGGSNGLLTQGLLDERYFRLLGASRLDRTLCAAPTGAAAQELYGKMASSDFSDFADSRFILLWGANPRASNIHLMPHLRRARARGARVALVDPRQTLSASDIDFHLAVRPGTDLVVALAMIAHLDRQGAVAHDFLAAMSHGAEQLLELARPWTLERAAAIAGIAASDIASVAEAYAASDPAMVRCGWGLERNRNGESAVAAVLALPAIAGKFGKRGGGYALSASGAYGLDDRDLHRLPPPSTRTVNMTELGRALEELADPPIQALFVYNANPVVTVPEQRRIERGLMRPELYTVVVDQVMTDTARYADIVLPATTFLEHRELNRSYGSYGVALSAPVVPPMGEALPNEAIFRRLGAAAAARLGRGAELFTDSPERLLEDCLATIRGPLATGADVAALEKGEWLEFDFPGRHPVQFVNAYPRTADRKIQLVPAAWGDRAYRYLDLATDARYPLTLISPASGQTISSTLGECNLPEAVAVLHDADGRARGIETGAMVRLHNPLGEIVCRAELSPRVRQGVVVLPKGLWRRASRNGAVATALVPAGLTAIAGGACFNDARIEVERLHA